MATPLVPAAADLPAVVATERISATGRPTPAFREALRRIPDLRNAGAVTAVWAQTAVIVTAAVRIDRWWAWVAAFLLMGPTHARFAALMHEAAHRLLFSNRRINDTVGRWLLGFPTFTPIDSYRRGHMAHHREEFGPDEPDIPLYRGYPISRASFRRKLVRDATGRTGTKLMRGLFRALRSSDPSTRFQARAILGCQVVLLALAAAAGHPLVYVVLWLGPFLTVWRVINRLRSVAEHGGMVQSRDRRQTTHSVRQHPLARALLVPAHIGWHLAHHVDPGIPMARLPRFHRELRRAGYLDDHLEYPGYLALWRRLSSG